MRTLPTAKRLAAMDRGEWDGMDKAGCGTYRYPSKARYEGEWQANTKEGYGIYYFPKGGLYKVSTANGALLEQHSACQVPCHSPVVAQF